jgi:hypothetical protein
MTAAHGGASSGAVGACSRDCVYLPPLTEAGQAAAARVLAAIADLEREAFVRLDAAQLAGYHAVINALQEAC